MVRTSVLAGLLAALLCGPVTPAVAQAAEERGPVTNLPLPRYVSLKTSEGNARRGPSLTHRIDWVYTRRDMPLEIVAEYGHWRRVRDKDGAGGWIHYALLSGVRTVLVEEDMLELHAQPDPETPVEAKLALGVIAQLEACNAEWCQLSAGGYEGWAPKSAMWGVAPDEIRE
ncbi:aspartyl-trna synthetase [Salipiger sp. CCB-MM3]|uniref:SH3 domain-containing protein n=1 Tax=Salipiger sp. CCB-MM3 TaxID=1792508 RepID=UPI00080A9D6C|nr:SH3 domain-containing protein [Salipiger sp. CCB-MM3]ANT60185.1 aspartyl-trna synthetase [Salipiger sp. CCB-MM3]